MTRFNTLKVGATRQGKTLAAARNVVETGDEAAVIFDPHKQSLAETVLTHVQGNVLYERLSDIRSTLGFELLAPSHNPEPVQRQLENQRRAEAFVEILLRRRNTTDGMAGAPLMEEWCMAAIMLYLFQGTPKPLALLPYSFMPGTAEFRALVHDCTLPDIRHKFQQLEKLNPRALRAEVGQPCVLSAPYSGPRPSSRGLAADSILVDSFSRKASSSSNAARKSATTLCDDYGRDRPARYRSREATCQTVSVHPDLYR